MMLGKWGGVGDAAGMHSDCMTLASFDSETLSVSRPSLTAQTELPYSVSCVQLRFQRLGFSANSGTQHPRSWDMDVMPAAPL